MSFYTEKAGLVVRLLEQFGQPVTLIRESGKVCDPVTGVCQPGTVERLEFNGVMKSYRREFIDGTMIMQGDRLLILDAQREPQNGDKAEIDGEQWQVISIVSIDPAGVPMAYNLQVRR